MSFLEELKRRNVIRVALAYVLIAWVLLQAADFGLDLIDAPNWVIQSLFLLAAIGLPGVLVFSWVFEMTPEGIRKESEVDRSQSITTQTGRKLNTVIVGALMLAVAYLLLDKLVLSGPSAETPGSLDSAVISQPAPSTAEPENTTVSVAVLPFVNMSDDKQNEYFSDGLTETLLHMLAQLPDLQVAARTSSFAFKGQNKSVGEIAETLGVSNILEGSVQRAGDQVRVTAQLVRAENGFHIWSQNYTRPMTDIFAIQDEIAADVANALGASLLGTNTASMKSVETRNVTAYDSYLKGLDEQAKFSYASLPLAERHFKTALATDPGFTEARLALVRNNMLRFSTGLIDLQEMLALNRPLLVQVREKDPGNRLARAYELTMDLRPSPTVGREELQLMINELRELLAVIPTETLVRLRVAATLNGFFNDPVGAREVLRAGLLIDPMVASLHAMLGRVLMQEKELDAAEASLLRSLELEPDNPNTYDDLHNLEKERNRMARALDWARRAIDKDPQDHERVAALAKDFYNLDLPEEGDRWLARLQALAPGSPLARSVELERARARRDLEQVTALAHAMIADQVPDRQSAFGDATFTYGDVMLRMGRADEAYDALAGIRPEITNYDQMASDFRGVIMQVVSVGLMSAFEPPDTQREAWSKLTAQFDAMGFPWRDPDAGLGTWDLLIRGEAEAAIEQYLSGPLQRPLAADLRRRERRFEPLMSPVYDDPRVVARLGELDRQYKDMRSEVESMLLQPEWNP